ncbi:hypothetical protein F5Y17DRAFT_457114 [Xylariaceae sp. FL0594]|nr:hypothetical protein F5Y17DRAFT_457114 [Xylariaceae sp. FL0594]
MARSNKDNHGLPYPLNSTIPGGPEDPASNTPQPREKGLAFHHLGRLDDPYAALRRVDTILLIDDSDSMQSCWDEVGDFLRIVAPVITAHDSDGVGIEFVHHRATGYHLTGRSGWRHIGNVKGRLDMCDSVAGIFHHVQPKGRKRRNKIDKRLGVLLDRYVDEDVARALSETGGKRTPPPLNVIVVTDCDWGEDGGDGLFNDDGAIARTARKLDQLHAPPYQVGVQVFRVGETGRNRTQDELKFMDDGLWKLLGVRDMVDTTTWTGKPGELSPDGILKVVLGAVRRSVDFMEV